MESTLSICPWKVDILRKFKMFEFAALGECSIAEEIALLNFFLQAKVSIAGISNLLNILKMSTLQLQIIPNLF